MAKKKPAHISHVQPRAGGKFVKTKASAKESEPLETPLTVQVPNAGQPVIPHVTTFQGLIQSISGRRTYLPPDTAIRQSRLEADRMLADCVVKNPLNERFRGTTSAEWHIEPEDATDTEQVAMADGLTRIVKRIPRWRKYLYTLLLAEFHGRAAVNNCFNWVIDGDERFIGITRWEPVHGDKLVFDENGDVGVKVGATIPAWMNTDVDEEGRRSLDQTIMGRVFWLSQHKRPLFTVHHGEIRDGLFEDVYSAGSVYGLGIRHHIYWSWWLKQDTQTSMLDAMARYGTGLRIFYYTEGSQESLNEVKAAAEAQSGNNIILFPRPLGDEKSGPRIEQVEMSGEGLKHMVAICRDYYDRLIRQAIVGQELSSSTGESGTGMGSGVSDQHAHTKSEIIQDDAASLAETLTTELLPQLAAYNYPRQPMRCRFVFDVDDSERAEFMESCKFFYDMGGALPENDVRARLGIPAPVANEPVLQKTAAPTDGPPDADGGSPFALTSKPDKSAGPDVDDDFEDDEDE